jgi:acetyl-CoA carboxylase carboxyltransferase component
VVNFDGPIVFCVVSRYHGGAFVVFSNALNENLEVAALEGTYASVIGGAPAAAVVFAREVQRRIREDARMRELTETMRQSEGAERVRLQTQIEEFSRTIRSEKLGEVADEFDATHSVQRAQEVGSVQRIIPPGRLRPYLIDAVERGMRKTLEATDESPLQTRVLEQL